MARVACVREAKVPGWLAAWRPGDVCVLPAARLGHHAQEVQAAAARLVEVPQEEAVQQDVQQKHAVHAGGTAVRRQAASRRLSAGCWQQLAGSAGFGCTLLPRAANGLSAGRAVALLRATHPPAPEAVLHSHGLAEGAPRQALQGAGASRSPYGGGPHASTARRGNRAGAPPAMVPHSTLAAQRPPRTRAKLAARCPGGWFGKQALPGGRVCAPEALPAGRLPLQPPLPAGSRLASPAAPPRASLAPRRRGRWPRAAAGRTAPSRRRRTAAGTASCTCEGWGGWRG